MPDRRYVVVGGGLAAGSAAVALRESGATGPVTVLAAEPVVPYERPPLSKEFLKGDKPFEELQVEPASWYHDRGVDLRTGTSVVALDRDRREVGLDDGSRLPYDRLLLATGADPAPLPVPGGDGDGLHLLRSVADARLLRAALEPGGRRVVVVGAGWIGLEVAAAARGYGNEVTVLEKAPAPLSRALGEEVGAFFGRVHREEGVDLRTGVGVAAVEPRTDGAEGATVVDEEGTRHDGDVVVVGAGIRPATGLADGAGLQVRRGIVVDAAMRTADPAVWAAGDAAEAFHPYLGRHLHVEHWAFARHSGAAAGRSMAGEEVTLDRVPYFFTDQYDVGMEFSGTTDEADRVVYRGSPQGRELVAFWLAGDRVVAGMNVNVWDVVEPIQAIVRSGSAVDVARLTDPRVPLEELVP